MPDSDFDWMACDDTLDAVKLFVVLVAGFAIWPLVLAILLVAMGFRWRRLARRRLAKICTALMLVTATWCAFAIAGAWWLRGLW